MEIYVVIALLSTFVLISGLVANLCYEVGFERGDKLGFARGFKEWMGESASKEPAVLPMVWETSEEVKVDAAPAQNITVTDGRQTVKTIKAKPRDSRLGVDTVAPKRRLLTRETILEIQEAVAGGESQYSVAKRLGLSTSTVWKWCHQPAPEKK